MYLKEKMLLKHEFKKEANNKQSARRPRSKGVLGKLVFWRKETNSPKPLDSSNSNIDRYMPKKKNTAQKYYTYIAPYTDFLIPHLHSIMFSLPL